MTEYNIYDLRSSTVLHLYSQRDEIQIDPDYQRMGEVWTTAKRQLLIDSIINELDIPKLYFHRLRPKTGDFEYAIIDGRQRLESIWRFIDGNFGLGEDFVYLKDKSVDAKGLTYKEFTETYPRLASRFDSAHLSVVIVETDEIDFIEDMFSRLNEAVPLNAAEKRNAFAGPLPKLARRIAEHDFFRSRVRVSNSRYQHRDLAAKIMLIQHAAQIVDVKKAYLDEFFRSNKNSKEELFESTATKIESALDTMQKEFTEHDPLLKSPAMIVVYYNLFSSLSTTDGNRSISRKSLQNFEARRANNRTIAEEDLSKANYDLLEFDKLMRIPDDKYAIKERCRILSEFLSAS